MSSMCERFLLNFVIRYPSVRVAYIDEVEEVDEMGRNKHRDKIVKKVEKVYYSALVKAMPKSVDSSEPDQKLDQVKVRLCCR